MRILIASTTVPFVDGGATFIVDWLAKMLGRNGFQVEVLSIPFHSHYENMPEQMLSLRLMDLSSASDLLITIRTPSYIINHPNKVAWFIHHHRTAYDLWGTEYQEFPNTEEGLAYRQTIIDTDNQYLPQAKKIFTNSQVVTDRLKKFNNIDSTVLYQPLFDPERFYHEQYGDYLFYPSRIVNHKRQMLAVESMKYTQSDARLVIAGGGDQPKYVQAIKSYIERENLYHKVTLLDRWISEAEKINLMASSLAGLCIPVDEDCYGYTTLEFLHSRKPVITCNDSGGILEIIENGINGYITPPDPKQIAENIDKLYLDRKHAATLGKNAYDSIFKLKITWENVIESLTT